MPIATGSVPVYVALASAILLSLYAIFHWKRAHKTEIEEKSGRVVVAYNVARLLTCLTLLAWTIQSIDQGLIFAYSSMLSLLVLKSNWSEVAELHLNVVLLTDWVLFAYRDLYPLATFTLEPVDGAEGWSLWFKVALLTFVAVFIPLFVPRKYVPVDTKKPMSHPNAEQTASIISKLFFSFMDSVVFAAYRVPHLPTERFPVLADYDDAYELKKRMFPYLDRYAGAKTRLIWGLFKAFRWDLTRMAITLLILIVAELAAPISINRLLHYLETNGQGAVVRPWVWILLLFLGPMAFSCSFERYSYLTSWVLVKVEVIITQLVFEHALRIRVKADKEQNGPSEKGQQNMIGKMNNLVTSDLTKLAQGREFMRLFLSFQIILSTMLLYYILGWSALVGFVLLVVLIPVPGVIATRLRKLEFETMKKSDARVQMVTEAMNVLRMIKLFGWESKVNQRIEEKRDEELAVIKKERLVALVSILLSGLIPLFTMLMTFATYTIIMKRQLTASVVFSSMPIFALLRMRVSNLIFLWNTVVTSTVSVTRVEEFLTETELLDKFSGTDIPSPPSSEVIGFHNTRFIWSDEKLSASTYRLEVEGELLFHTGRFNIIVGPTGSGKTSMLLALLGEMHYLSDSDSWYNLPRSGGVAYCPQESWILNDTIKNNILFHSPYSQERYRNVLSQCHLEPDLRLLPAGDETEVGAKTLSGGQKARISLARAIYSNAEIILLDDILSALDVHTATWIVKNCFGGDLLRGRTVILVTHNISLVSPIADFAIALSGGKVQSRGTVSEVLKQEPALLVGEKNVDLEKEEIPAVVTVEAPEPKPVAPAGKLIKAEEAAEGHVSWKSVKSYFEALGGRHYLLYYLLYLFVFFGESIVTVLQSWYLGHWAAEYDGGGEVNPLSHLGIYAGIIFISMLFQVGRGLTFMFGSLRASKTIHVQLMQSLFASTLRWLDTTPFGSIITRCTQDIKTVDFLFAIHLLWVSQLTASMLVRFVSVFIITPEFLFAGLFVALLGAGLAEIYIKAQLSTKREMTIAKAPILANFGAAIAGLPSIRAYGAEEIFIEQSFKHSNHYTRSARPFYNLNCWIGVRLAALGGLLSSALATWLVYFGRQTPGTTGFSLSLAIEFTTSIFQWVKMFNMLEVTGNSLERIDAYMHIEHEPLPTKDGLPPARWPSSGELVVEDLSARYDQDGPKVLDNVSFRVRSGERVAIVGRTGSGKTTLTLSLLRGIPTSGVIYYDGLAIDKIDLDILRSKITIIPQSPELLSGTLRDNLDPFQEHDDATLNDALRSAGLFNSQTEAVISLDSSIASSGGNLSVGQRQIIALARAILRRSKLLIMDEATSSIDYETDTIIQSSLRTQLAGVTILTIAHRLQTVMDYDKIIVLDSGRLVEFDTPKSLLSRETKFKALVDESKDREMLYSMIKS